VEEDGCHVRVFVANDQLTPWQGTWCWALETLNGELVETGTVEVNANPLTASLLTVFDFTRAVKKHGAAQLVFTAGLYENGQRVSRQAVLFAREKEIIFPNPELHWDVTQESDRLLISLTANAFARYVELQLDGADVVFSDNFFDLQACETIQISCPLPDGWTLEKVKSALHVHSLADVLPAGSKTQDAIKHMLLGLKPASLISRIIFSFLE